MLSSDSRISLKKGVSIFRSNDESLFLKHNNKLSKIASSPELAQISRIFQILRRPKKLKEILNLMSEFKRRDIIDALHTLHKHSFITIRENKISKKNEPDLRTFLMDSIEERKPPYSQITLIGNGLLANRLAMILKKTNVKMNQIRSVEGLFKPTKKTVNEILGENNIGISETSPYLSSSFTSSFNESELIIVAEDCHNIALFELINKICFKKKKAWIRMSFDDDIGYLGPLVLPGRTSCFNCCELRLVTNSPEYEYELWRNKDHIPITGLQVPIILADFLSFICVKEVLKYLTGREVTETVDTLMVFDTRQPNLTKHRLIRHPNCIYCNSVGLAKKLHSNFPCFSFKVNRQVVIPKSNFDRSSPLSESELLEKLRKLIDLRTGIVLETRKLFVDNKLGIRSHYFFYAPCYNPIRIGLEGELTNLFELGNRFMDPSPSGSGLSPNEAEMHALMETVERYSNTVADNSRLIYSRYMDIEKNAINPLDMGLYSDEVYALDRRISKFSADSEIPWIKGHDLYSGKPVFIAADFVHYPSIRDKPIVFDSSNGASAHTNIVSAILNGLYEVIERDSFLSMWLNRIPMPILDIKTLPGDFDRTVGLINKYGMNVKLVDLTSDSLVPTVLAVCYNKNPRKFPALDIGIATNIQPEKAVQRALLEMEVALMLHLEEAQEKKVRFPKKIISPSDHSTYYLNPKMRKYWEFMISSEQTSKLFTLSGSMLDDHNFTLKQIVTRLHKIGHRVICVDIAPSDIRSLGLSAVKVFVTGFQPLYFQNKLRLNRNRLQELAQYVRNNIGATRTSTDLNSAPHPLD